MFRIHWAIGDIETQVSAEVHLERKTGQLDWDVVHCPCKLGFFRQPQKSWFTAARSCASGTLVSGSGQNTQQLQQSPFHLPVHRAFSGCSKCSSFCTRKLTVAFGVLPHEPPLVKATGKRAALSGCLLFDLSAPGRPLSRCQPSQLLGLRRVHE